MPRFSGPVLPVSEVVRRRGVLIFLAIWMVINLVTGIYSLTPGGGGIAWEAHVGGFLLGFFGISAFDRSVPDTEKRLEMEAGPAHDEQASQDQGERWERQGRRTL